MKSKMKRMLAALAAFVLIGLVLALGNSLVGNPVSRWRVDKAAQGYLAQAYPGTQFQVKPAYYSFKFSEYYVQVQSPISQDTAFTLCFLGNGTLRYDSYESDVTNRFVTWQRLESELRQKSEALLNAHLPYDLDNAYLSFFDGEINEAGMKNLVPDMQLDITRPPMPMEVRLVLFSETQNYDTAAQVALETRRLLESQSIPVSRYNILLLPIENKQPEGEAVSWAGGLSVNEVPAELLNEKDLPQALEEFQAQWERSMNEVKEKEQ